MPENVTRNDQLTQLLRSLLRRTALLHVASGLVSFVASSAWLLVVLAAWTAMTDAPSAGVARAISWITIAVLLLLFGFFVVWPLIRMPRLHTLAAEVEKRRDLHELLRAGFEFSNDPEHAQRYSPHLVREVIHQAVEQVSGLQVRFLFLTRRDLALIPLAFGGLIVLLVLSLVSPSVLTRAGARVVSPSSVAAVEHRANIFAQPGNITILAGSDIVVTGLDLGRSPDPVTISFDLAEDFWKTEPTTAAASDAADEFNRYQYTFHDLRHTISYYFSSGSHESAKYTITVVYEPILTEMKVRLTPPSYTGEPATVLVDNGGNVQALEGTRVDVEGIANNGLASASIRFDDRPAEPVAVDGHALKFHFTALKDGQYSVLLHDSLGFHTREPLVYTVEVFHDHAPAIEVLEPGGDSMMPRNRKLDLGFVASDDYGVASAALMFRRSGQAEFAAIPIPLAARNRKEIATAWNWDLAAVQLIPGQYIEYFLQVKDNNVVTGPGVTNSRTYQITVPSMADLYDRVKEDDGNRADKMEEAIRDSQELRERLEKISRDFLKTEKMEWTQKKEVDRALDKQAAVETKLNDVKNSLDETLKELSENQLTSQEIGEKLEEIRQLMDEINNDELRQHMEDLRQAMEKMNPEDIREALKDMEISTEDMMKKLERTAELLKQIAREQKMEEMVRQSKDMMESQKDLNEETAEASEGDQQKMEELSKKQQELARQADDMEKSMKDFSEQAQKDEQKTAEQLQQLAQEMNSKEGPQKNMREASKSLSEQQKQQAQQQQQEAMEKMISLFRKMSKTQQQMQQQQGQRMAANLQKFARQVLELSQRQEALAAELKGWMRPQDNSSMQELAQEQMSYMRATEAIADEILKLAGQSLALSPQLMESLGSALERMQSSVLFLEQGKPFMSTAHANNAVQSLNEATIEMLRSAKKCSSGSSGSGSSAQQMMQAMIPKQQNIAQQTQQMLQMQAMGEAMRQQRMESAQRLAGEQRSLRELAREIQSEMKANRELIGRLDKTVEEMEAVVQALESGNIDSDLVNKEQRIVSRLLDAERSVHTRDYEKKRESMTADDVFSRSLGSNGDMPLSQTLREEIRRAMQLKAPGEFEDLIKLYFRALAEESAGGRRVETN